MENIFSFLGLRCLHVRLVSKKFDNYSRNKFLELKKNYVGTMDELYQINDLISFVLKFIDTDYENIAYVNKKIYNIRKKYDSKND